MEELMKFLQRNVKYPKEAQEQGKQGRVVVQFVVNKDGSITDAKIVKSVDPQLDAEALRVVNAMPNWTPGKQRGKEVRTYFTIPVTFRLNK
jgi:protein TonB